MLSGHFAVSVKIGLLPFGIVKKTLCEKDIRKFFPVENWKPVPSASKPCFGDN